MMRKSLLPKLFLGVTLTVAGILVFLVVKQFKEKGAVAGISTDILSPVGISNPPSVYRFPTNQPTSTVVLPSSTPAPIYSIVLIYLPTEMTEGENVTFTWDVRGSSTAIPTTSVYFGTTSVQQIDSETYPSQTSYNQFVTDFINGSYNVPLQFTGSVSVKTPGTYFARAYARIGDKHYWSDERSFVVKPLPKYEIKVVNYPSKIAKGANASFTWEVLGPEATTGFTTIVVGKLSKPGALDATVNIPQTPYAILVKDFTSGTFNVPLRFVGNGIFSETGEYFFRALAFVNSKNIWSEEYSLSVE